MEDKFAAEEDAKPSSQQNADSAIPMMDRKPGDELESVSVHGADAGDWMPPKELSPMTGEGDKCKDLVRGERDSGAEPSELGREGDEGSVDRESGSVAESSELHRDGEDPVLEDWDSVLEDWDYIAEPTGTYRNEDSIRAEQDSVAESSNSRPNVEKFEAPVQESDAGRWTESAEESEEAGDILLKNEEDEMDDVEDLEAEIMKVENMLMTQIDEEAAIFGTTMEDLSVTSTSTQEETDMANVEEEEQEAAAEVEEENKVITRKRKRGKNSKAVKGSGKKAEEDVCFICLHGGDLVLCDRRGCPKAYHSSCVGRDAAFFQSKGKWNCGWHLCSKCEKTAFYMCYTCINSLCKACSKDAVIFCIRGNKGLCDTCMGTVKLIESSQQENKETADDMSWEYLFKDYWTDLKNRLSITSEELDQAKCLRKGRDSLSNKLESSNEQNDVNDSERSESWSPLKRRKTRRQSKSYSANAKGNSSGENAEWASGELLEVIAHMRNGDRSFLPRSEVQTLLLDYIKRYNLRDPRRKSQVISDSRLQNLFGKSRVGQFEMLNLLDSHFHVKDDTQADNVQGSAVDADANYLDSDESPDHPAKTVKGKKRKLRKKSGSRGQQSNLNDYGSIDMHNINLIYLRRNLVEDLMEDPSTFHGKVVGGFVRIRISSNQKQDTYRLVQVVGTSRAPEPYKVGKQTTDYLLEILNLNKTEMVPIDKISHQDFSEDECKRLRQSIKLEPINSLTVGDIQEKAIMLQEVRVKNRLEAETKRLNHLRDRASDMGHRKEFRICVEKLQLLQSPEERQRRLEEIPEIHADPSMDPNYESEGEDETEEKEQDTHRRPKGRSSFNKRAREQISPRKGSFGCNDSWSRSSNYSNSNRIITRNLSGKGFSSRGYNSVGSDEKVNVSQRRSSRDKETKHHLTDSEKPRSVYVSESLSRNLHAAAAPEISPSKVVQKISPAALSQSVPQNNESENMWLYKDPSGEIRGPFSVVQLRKWNKARCFPAGLRIWKSAESPEDSILVTDAVAGKFGKRNPPVQSAYSGKGLSTLEMPKQEPLSSATNLPSPTPDEVSTPIKAKMRGFRSRWSPTPPVQTGFQAANPYVLHSGPLPSFKPETNHPGSANIPMNHPGSAMTVQSPLPSSGRRGWGNPSLQTRKSGNPQNTSSPAFGSGNPSGVFPAPRQSNFPQPDAWRQSNANMGWMRPVQQPGTNMNWVSVGPGSAQGNPNSSWIGPNQEQAQGGYSHTGWGIPAQAQTWAAPSQGSVPTNPNPHGTNRQGYLRNRQNPNNRFPNQRDRDPSGYGAGDGWNRQPSFGSGGPSRQGICKFFRDNGHCKKGASCDYLHY